LTAHHGAKPDQLSRDVRVSRLGSAPVPLLSSNGGAR
jgi:hypothetical protein